MPNQNHEDRNEDQNPMADARSPRTVAQWDTFVQRKVEEATVSRSFYSVSVVTTVFNVYFTTQQIFCYHKKQVS
jgi:hypothetical protein